MRREAALAVFAATLLGLAGCASADLDEPPPPSVQAASTSHTALDVSGTALAEELHEHPAPSPTHDGDSDAAASTAASSAIEAYLDRDLVRSVWLRQLAPHLTADAVVSLGSVDPTRVPSASVLRPVSVERSSSGYLATAVAATEIGDYELLLARPDGTAPWLVARITPPEAVR